jgi:hypothetical protein
MTAMFSLTQRRNRVDALRPPPPPTFLAPQDQRRLHCTDAACLRKAADSLSPPCAAFLLGGPEPSPAPMPASASGFFSVVASGPDGEVHRMNGPVPSRIASGMSSILMPPELREMMPPEIRAFFGAGPNQLIVIDENDDDDDEPEAPAHPCAREVAACAREVGSSRRDAIEACLVHHYDGLSSQCKCFVHHTASNAEASHPRLVAVAPTEDVAVEAELVDHTREMHPLHRLSCLFLFTAFLLSFVLICRACAHACFGAPSSRKRRAIVVVPPHDAKIVRSDGQPVQVAEPLTIKA